MRLVGLVPWVTLAALAAGCSTSPVGVDASVDAASGLVHVGAPCDPSLAAPCLPTGDDCLAVTCDSATRVCTEHVPDSGALCHGGTAPCTKTTDCDTGLLCGFPIGGGCDAPGVCINPPLPCQSDAAACTTGGTVCGCGGVPVPVLIPGYAASPTAGSSACGPDAGGVLEGGADGASFDASDGGQEQ